MKVDYDQELQKRVTYIGSWMGCYHGLAKLYFEVSCGIVHLSEKDKE